jgi:hypothetical protein
VDEPLRDTIPPTAADAGGVGSEGHAGVEQAKSMGKD